MPTGKGATSSTRFAADTAENARVPVVMCVVGDVARLAVLSDTSDATRVASLPASVNAVPVCRTRYGPSGPPMK